MYFVSNLIGKPVSDLDGRKVGSLRDLLARSEEKMPHPKIIAIEVKKGRDRLFISIEDVAVLIAPAIPLKKSRNEIKPYTPHADDLYLVRDVLDKQIIDINGVRVVRVNDLELGRVDGDMYIANVDVSGYGLLRRLGLGGAGRKLLGREQKGIAGGMISWDDMELIASDQPMRLKVPGDKITELHPADIAEILSDLSRPEGSKFLETLDIKQVADTLEEVEPDFQASLISQMPDEQLADLLEEMAPDEAADLLAELPQDRSQDLLDLMEDEDAKDVRILLTYPENSVGGIMNTEYITVQPQMTAGQVIELLRRSSEEAETVYYIYVTDKEGHLIGVFSLVELVLAQPDTPVKEFMDKRVVSIKLTESQVECAQLVSKYNLVAIPVVDDKKCLQGIVTADDALDHIIPTAWKKRLPRFYH